MKKTDSTDSMIELQRQLRTLQEQVTRLEQRLETAERRTDFICTSLKVVDANGKQVALIDKTGHMYGTMATIRGRTSSTPILINGTTGTVHCGQMTVYGTKTNQVSIELNGTPSFQPFIRMRSEDVPKDGWSVRLTANRMGGRVEVTTAKKTSSARAGMECSGAGLLYASYLMPNNKAHGAKLYSGGSPAQGGYLKTYYEDTVTAMVPPRVSRKSKQAASKKGVGATRKSSQTNG